MEIKNKTVIVTGSGAGIGRSIALEFARQGANVVCCARREDAINATVKEIENEGGQGLAVKTDVTDKKQVDAMVSAACERFGKVDILINNAGSFNTIGGIWQVDVESWWKDVTINLLGPMLCSQAVLPGMISRNEGIIINVNGGGALNPLPGGSGYGCSKAALLRLTDTLAKELEKIGSNVMVFAQGPGFVRTDMTEIQANTKEGKEWLPDTGEAFEAGLMSQPECAGKAMVDLVNNACLELSGRIFETNEDFNDLLSRAQEIKLNDSRTMRFRE